MQRKRAAVYWALVVTAAVLACGGLLLVGGAVLPAAASVLQQVGATPMAAQGAVTAAALNVRAEPALTGRVVGTLRLGSQVNILGQRGSWYQIEDGRGPGGKGWVSARFVRIGGGNASQGAGAEAGAGAGGAPGGAAGAGQIPAPSVVAYQPPVLRWKWAGAAGALSDKDWYFDVQVIRKFDAYPYWTQVVEQPGKAKGAQQQGDTYRVDIQAIQFRCDSSIAVQIAVRENGRFAGWISPRSNLLLFTPVCQQSSPTVVATAKGSDDDSKPNPEPSTPGGSQDEDPRNPEPPPTPTDAQPDDGGQTNPEPPPTETPSDGGGQPNPEPTATPPYEAPPVEPPVEPPPETTAVPTP